MASAEQQRELGEECEMRKGICVWEDEAELKLGFAQGEVDGSEVLPLGTFYRTLTPELEEFIKRQRIFFTATAPSNGGRINLSPKGYDTFRILDDRTVCYLDFAGSGNETANHILENGRITFMWCSFDTRPLVLRLYCYGELVEKDDPRFAEMMGHLFAEYDPRHVRRIILARIESAQTSCGWGIPFFEYRGERPSLAQWSRAIYEKGELEDYIVAHAPRSEEKFPLEPPAARRR